MAQGRSGGPLEIWLGEIECADPILGAIRRRMAAQGGRSVAGTFQDGLVGGSKKHLLAGGGDHQVKKS